MYLNTKSKGECVVSEYLTSLNYDVMEQVTFAECRDVRVLPFDVMFCIDNQVCLIEFDGKQHFESVDFFGGDEAFKRIKRHDRLKNRYCKENNIPDDIDSQLSYIE